MGIHGGVIFFGDLEEALASLTHTPSEAAISDARDAITRKMDALQQIQFGGVLTPSGFKFGRQGGDPETVMVALMTVFAMQAEACDRFWDGEKLTAAQKEARKLVIAQFASRLVCEAKGEK